MKQNLARVNILVVFGLSLLSVVAMAPTALAGNTTTNLSGGGKAVTVTTTRGTECTFFNPQGNLICTRTFAITDHKAGVAKYLQTKCK